MISKLLVCGFAACAISVFSGCEDSDGPVLDSIQVCAQVVNYGSSLPEGGKAEFGFTAAGQFLRGNLLLDPKTGAGCTSITPPIISRADVSGVYFTLILPGEKQQCATSISSDVVEYQLGHYALAVSSTYELGGACADVSLPPPPPENNF